MSNQPFRAPFSQTLQPLNLVKILLKSEDHGELYCDLKNIFCKKKTLVSERVYLRLERSWILDPDLIDSNV
jgi:hypothetical protein